MILLSIYPEYVKKILKGSKKYEFRKSLPNKRINRLINKKYIAVYESSPKSSIILVFEIGQICENNINMLWEKFGKLSGITKEYFLGYYHGRNRGVAIEIKRVIKLKKPISLIEIKKYYPQFIPPQNFYELSEEKYPVIYKKLRKELSK